MILENFLDSFHAHISNNAFCIDEVFYTYGNFWKELMASEKTSKQ